jgi:riboflavin synthase
VGDLVNIETDMVGKYVEKLLRKEKPGREEKRSFGITEDMLMKCGFGD